MPEETKVVTWVGKGGSGKSTNVIHVMAHHKRRGVRTVGFDADEPGDGDEKGSLSAFAARHSFDVPVYRAPVNATAFKEEVLRHAPGAVAHVDAGAWERRIGNRQMAAMAAADLIICTAKPTGMDMDRAGSVYAARDQLASYGVKVAPIWMVLTMVDGRTSARRTVYSELSGGGIDVFETQIPLSNAANGYANVWDTGVILIPEDPMDLLAVEILEKLNHG